MVFTLPSFGFFLFRTAALEVVAAILKKRLHGSDVRESVACCNAGLWRRCCSDVLHRH
ncbi:hypothetical protein MANES_15G057501v8 [Manihot esculenta]|uniref:Uncharacterized protein n=1 Tax=Manihot esculenta TaxID=3983 RepID=A0ACB7GDX3_MANES|nr:hypothetical protein MANES_15G057501v8 [Manihot esculenta]